MNIQQYVLTVAMISLLFGNVTLLSMRCDYKGTLTIPKPDRIKKLSSEVKEHLVDYLDNPITFGKTNKKNHELVKLRGLRNIGLALKKKDPDFVISHYVPVLLIDTSNKRNSYTFNYISPYPLIRMSNNFFYREDIIIPLRNKRIKQVFEQKRIQYDQCEVKLNNFSDCSGFPLKVAVLFGDDNDILQELQALRNDKDFALFGDGGAIHGAIRAKINYPGISNNNAFEILLSVKKEMDRPINTSDIQLFFFYDLLFAADKAKNKKAFKALVTKDPFDAKKTLWVDPYAKNRMEDVVFKPNTPLTTLDRMIEEGNFDPENIALFKQLGGKTSENPL